MSIKLKSLNEFLEDVVLVYETESYGTLIKIDEGGAKLSRVLKLFDSNQDFMMITASRGSNSKKENSLKNNELIKSVRAELGTKTGAYKIIGHWKECSIPLKDKETIKDCKGTITNNLEETWLITKPENVTSEEFDNIAQKIAKKYQQDGYVIRLDGKLQLKGKDGATWNDLGTASSKSLSAGFSKILDTQGYSELARNRKHGNAGNIVFENLYYAAPKDNISSKRLFSELNILY